jgi:hypothetical protein
VLGYYCLTETDYTYNAIKTKTVFIIVKNMNVMDLWIKRVWATTVLDLG